MRNRIGRPRFMQSFASAGGGPFLATPPSDGETYGVRNSDTWIEVCEEAPKNGTLYGRVSNAWQAIPSGGDPGTATGVLFTPAGNISATNVQAALQELDNEKVAKAGGANAIMTGFLTLHADPDAPLKAATKQYVDAAVGTAGVTIADAAPTPTQGKMWWESDTGVLWMSYTDASSTQWIGVGGTTAAISDASKADKTYVDAQDALKADKTYVDAQDLLSVLRDGTRTMTGNLTITKSGPQIILNKTAAGSPRGEILGQIAGSNRWALVMPSGGEDFAICRYDDTGTQIDVPFNIVRLTGQTNLPVTTVSTSPTTGALTVAGGVGIGGAVYTSGPLAVVNAAARLFLDKPASGGTVGIVGRTNGVARWSMQLGESTAESGSNTGSNFALYSLDDGGNIINTVMTVGRAAGNIQFPTNTASTSPTTGSLVVGGGVGIGGSLYSGTGVNVSNANPNMALVKPSSGGFATITSSIVSSRRWQIVMGDNAAESGSDNGSDFAIVPFTDGNVQKAGGLSILRSSGRVHMSSTTASSSPTTGALVVAGGVGIGGTVNCHSVTIAPPSGTWAAVYLNATGGGNPGIAFQYAGSQVALIYDNASAIIIGSNSSGSSGMFITHGGNAWSAMSDARLDYKKSARLYELPRLDDFYLYERTDGTEELFAKAQEIDNIFPHVVKRGSDDPDYIPSSVGDPDAWGMSYDRLGAIALAYLKQHASRLDALERRLRV